MRCQWFLPQPSLDNDKEKVVAAIGVQAQPWLPDLLKAAWDQLYAKSLLVYAEQPL